MKVRKPVGVAFVLSSMTSIHAQAVALTELDRVESYVPGEVLVCPVTGKALEVAAILGSVGLHILERDAISGDLRLAVPRGEERAWARLLASLPEVEVAELNGTGSGGLVPNDSYYAAQWHLRNTGQWGGVVGADIEAEAAWNLSTGSSSIVVAVLDTGIDSDHPDFAGRIDPDGRDFVNEDLDPEADHPHGTWVSGCVAANAGNGFATVGVDWNCRILPIKVLNQANQGTIFDLAQGLNYAATQDDVRIISMSLIDYPPAGMLRNALRNAHEAGKILIACAGNGGIGDANDSFPGASPRTISIGATTITDARAGFSGTGSRLDFVAPGDAIVTTLHGFSFDSYDVVSGCSFATPIVSGVVGLLLALGEQRGIALNQGDVFDLLREGAEDQVGLPNEDVLGRDNFHGYGRVNAYRSLLAVPLVLPLDIEPGVCPNPLQPLSGGKLLVSLLGTSTMDVHSVDSSSLLLFRADRIGGAVVPSEPASQWVVADVATPAGGATGDCHEPGGDGVPDLTLKFAVGELVEALELADVPNGALVELRLGGKLATGRPFVAVDTLLMVPFGRLQQPAPASSPAH